MSAILTVGYRRHADGSAIPVCDPPTEIFLLLLWRNVATATLYGPQCVITGTLDGAIATEGRLEPKELLATIEVAVTRAVGLMGSINEKYITRYPIDKVAADVAAQAGTRLLFCLDDPFVETVPPTMTESGKSIIGHPRIVHDGSHTRVIVTGHSRRHPLWELADIVIRARVRDAIVDRVSKPGAPES